MNAVYPFPEPFHPGLGSPAPFDRLGSDHYIPNGPQMYNPGPPWYVPYPPSIGMVGTPSTIYSRPSDYFGPPVYSQPPTPNLSLPSASKTSAGPLPVPDNVLVENGSERDQSPDSVAPGTPETEIRPEEEPQLEDTDIVTFLLERTTREKAPTLIRVEGAESDGEGEGPPVADGCKPRYPVPELVRSTAKRLQMEIGENALEEVIAELEVEMSGPKMSLSSEDSSGSRSHSSSRSCCSASD